MREPWTLTYRIVMALAWPLVAIWGRLEVVGLDRFPATGATLVVSNHDSQWDPLVVGVAARRHRQIEALSRSSLWGIPGLGWVLTRMRQHPVTRGRVNLRELVRVTDALVAGRCIGIFPEGYLSHGQKLPAFSGAGWLAKASPDCRIVCVAVTGSVDMARFPRRPRIRVEFFEPLDGPPQRGEASIAVSRRLLAEIRDRAPAVDCCRFRRCRKAVRQA